MFARATSGDKPNNNRFSVCSLRSMAQVMGEKARSYDGCFIGKSTNPTQGHARSFELKRDKACLLVQKGKSLLTD